MPNILYEWIEYDPFVPIIEDSFGTGINLAGSLIYWKLVTGRLLWIDRPQTGTIMTSILHDTRFKFEYLVDKRTIIFSRFARHYGLTNCPIAFELPYKICVRLSNGFYHTFSIPKLTATNSVGSSCIVRRIPIARKDNGIPLAFPLIG